jgi:arylsulfatase
MRTEIVRPDRSNGAKSTGNKFSGQIDWVQIDIGDDGQDHLIKAEDRLTVAMARQ